MSDDLFRKFSRILVNKRCGLGLAPLQYRIRTDIKSTFAFENVGEERSGED